MSIDTLDDHEPMEASGETVVALADLGVIASPSGAGALLLHGEEEADCLVVLQVWRAADRVRLPAIATFVGCHQSIFGYPNDEAYWLDPRRLQSEVGLGYGFYEVLGSSWEVSLQEYNRNAFPDTPSRKSLRHFFLGCHDSSGQFLAKDLTVETFEDDYRSVLNVALSRLSGLGD
jgi:hypothetical protein